MMMQLTPEQKREVERAKTAGEYRVILQFTDSQKQEWLESVNKELAGNDENVAHFRKLKAAVEQPGLFGDLRRAIQRCGMSLGDLSVMIGSEPKKLSAFLAGDEDLPAAVLDRLVEALGLRLMQEIPR